MTVIDAMGMACPFPVVKAKQAIEALPGEGGVVQVLVDNETATENLGKLAASGGYACDVKQEGEKKYTVTITVGSGRPEPAPATAPAAVGSAGVAVAIGKDAMGHGSEELGKILIKGFIFSLSQLPTPPQALLFFNSGVNLVVEGANTLEDLRGLAAAGVKILVCGTCLDYYQLKDKVAVGEVTNMYGIVEEMNAARSVINL